MSAYRITRLGAQIVVGTEDEAVLICRNLAVARRAVADAEFGTITPTWQLLSQRAAQIGEEAAAAALATDVAAMLVDAQDEDASR